MIFTEWLLDVTNASDNTYAFVPFENDQAVLGMTVIQDRSPGEIVGVISMNGQEDVEEWLSRNPGWEDNYGPAQGQTAAS